MAKNWMAYEAAEALYGNNTEEIVEVGSRYPLFARTVSMTNSNYVLDLLKAIPKVTARVIETGLKDIDNGDDVEANTEAIKVEEQDDAPVKETETKSTRKLKSKQTVDEDEENDDEENDDYESMTSKALYKLCCDRGISSQCKKRDKASLIAVLKANEGARAGDSDDENDWDEDDDEEKETDPYAGKSARELFKMCSDRGIKTKPRQSADAYVKLLKKADETEADTDVDDEDEDDDWEI